MSIPPRAYRPGESLEDFCRVCKTDRMHTVVVVDSDGRPMRVDCGYCHSEHNYRGGPRIAGSTGPATAARTSVSSGGRGPAGSSTRSASAAARSRVDSDPFPLVSERERTMPPMAVNQE